MEKIAIPPGVFDIVPDSEDQWRCSHLWNYLEKIAREVSYLYGYQEIRTPIFERVELFKRSVGSTSDIVSKEMYVFEDKGKRLMTLRPEGTASVMRAFIENQLQNRGQIHKLFYIGPMFRYDRPQAGRYRQHHQLGVEAVGNDSPEQDAEIIDLLYTFYNRLGLQHLKISINSLGNAMSRQKFREALIEYLRPHYDHLSQDSQNRLEANPLRVLDSKDANDQKIVAHAPSILDFLDAESKDHFEQLLKRLEALSIPFEINHNLVRGLDYYNKTVFEFVAGELGAQNSIGGGGRYDGLMKQLGGPDLPAMGFGTGLERIIQTMIKQGVALPSKARPTLFLIALGNEAKEYCFGLLHQLRERKIASQMDFSAKKLAKAMEYADSIQAKYVAVIGDDELRNDQVELKEMSSREKTSIALTKLVNYLELEEK